MKSQREVGMGEPRKEKHCSCVRSLFQILPFLKDQPYLCLSGGFCPVFKINFEAIFEEI